MMKDAIMTTMSNRYQADAAKNRPTMRHVAALAGVGIKTVSGDER